MAVDVVAADDVVAIDWEGGGGRVDDDELEFIENIKLSNHEFPEERKELKDTENWIETDREKEENALPALRDVARYSAFLCGDLTQAFQLIVH